ncbi:MAG TPA: phosphatidylglycerophosphatase A [Pyrinomonadaceae bacterium]|nr:phosphatidylglycerophosphatase A [Pyrinomonadaceae bacterium]
MKVVKESSDELNPSVLTTAFIGRPPRERTLRDYIALGVSTCGVGFIPLAPGTWGSALGVCIYLLVRAFGFRPTGQIGLDAGINAALLTTFLLLVIIAVSLAGTWAATRTETIIGRKDPGIVVVDEVAGQLITFVFMPWDSPAWMLAVGFVLFRVFDIWKPYPVRRLESLEAGLGIMADDVLAGIYAAALMSLLLSIYLLF